MNIIGDVEGKTCVLMDDMVDTAGTLCEAAAALKSHGAKQGGRVLHASGAVGPAVEQHQRIAARRTGGDGHHPAADAAQGLQRIRQLSVAELLAETMRRVAFGESVSSLYVD